jgi:hypothetical protein
MEKTHQIKESDKASWVDLSCNVQQRTLEKCHIFFLIKNVEDKVMKKKLFTQFI